MRQVLTRQVNDLENLLELAELVKDPSKIRKAHEEARKQMTLTEEEAKKVEELKFLLEAHEKMAKDLNSKREGLESASERHEKLIKELDEKNKSLQIESENFNKEFQKQTAIINQNEIRSKQLDEQFLILSQKQKEAKDLLEKNITREKELDRRAEKVRLREEASEL